MKYAVIDIGSNSVRLLKADIVNDKIIGTKRLIVTRLGNKNEFDNNLLEDKITDTISALKIFIEDSRNYGAKKIFAMATSAVRDADNKDYFLEKVYDQTGLKVDILTGNAEAEVGCIGVQNGLKKKECILIIDIGGGSTEFIIFDGVIKYSISIDIGAVRMTDKHVKNDPILNEEYFDLREEINSAIKDSMEEINKFNYRAIIGIGGTASTFGAIDLALEEYSSTKIHSHEISYDKICEINSKFKDLNLDMRKEIIGLEEKRADIILAGGLILEEIIENSNLGKYQISDYDNLEGYLIKNRLLLSE